MDLNYEFFDKLNTFKDEIEKNFSDKGTFYDIECIFYNKKLNNFVALVSEKDDFDEIFEFNSSNDNIITIPEWDYDQFGHMSGFTENNYEIVPFPISMEYHNGLWHEIDGLLNVKNQTSFFYKNVLKYLDFCKENNINTNTLNRYAKLNNLNLVPDIEKRFENINELNKKLVEAQNKIERSNVPKNKENKLER